MRKTKRRTHSPEFKARVGLEALKGIKTISEIAQENEIHPVQVSAWKKELQGRLAELFERKNAADPERESRERNVARLERRVGQLLIEKEFLEKKCKQLGVDLSERP
jgi:transposase-like protein